MKNARNLVIGVVLMAVAATVACLAPAAPASAASAVGTVALASVDLVTVESPVYVGIYDDHSECWMLPGDTSWFICTDGFKESS